MAIKYAVASGNWSSTSTWNGGTLPQAGDDVYANGKTVTIDMDINVGSLHNDAESSSGIVAGGYFTVADPAGTRNITCTGAEPNVVASNPNCLQISSPASTSTVNTSCSPKGGGANFKYGIYKDSTCMFTHTGNCYTGSANRTPGLLIRKGTSNTINGNGYGTTGGLWQNDSNGAISINGSGVSATINGTMYGGASFGLHVLSGATATLNGTAEAGTAQPGCYVYGSAKLTINLGTNQLKGHATASVPACRIHDSNGFIEVNGSTGALIQAQTGPAISSYLAGGRVRANVNLTPSTSNYAISGCSVELNATSNIASNGRPGIGAAPVLGLSSTFATSGAIKAYYYNAEAGTLGSLETLSTYDGYALNYPAESDVRHGVGFGPGSPPQYTGTCYVPAAASVAYGVNVDHTTGTAVLTPQVVANAVWDELRSNHTTTGTFGAVTEWAGGSGGATAAEIADAVWDEQRSQHTTTGTFGAVSEWAGGSGGATPAEIWSYATRTLSAATNIDTPIANAVWAATTRTLTAATNIDAGIADAVWDESRSGHTTTGTYGATGEWTATSADTWTYPTRTLTAGIPSAADIWSYTNRSLTDASVIADAVWDEQRSEHTTTGTFGAVTEWAGSGGATPAEIWSYTTRTLTAATNITDAIADGVWDELRSEHTTTGTFGAVSEWAGGSGGATAAEIADAVWDEQRSGHTVPGSFGNVSEWSTTASTVWTNSTRTLTAATGIDAPIADAVWAATTRVLTSAANIDAAIADAVWDEARSGHTAPGSYGATGEWASSTGDIWSHSTRTLTVGMPTAADIWSYSDRTLTGVANIADAVWDEQRSQHTTTGTFGAVSEWAGGDSAEAIWTYGTRTLTAATNINTAIADAVWDELRSDHTITGSFGAVSEWAGGATVADIWNYSNRTLTNVDNIADVVWDESRSGHTTTGTFGEALNTPVSSVVTDVFGTIIETGITFQSLCKILGSVIAGQITTAGTDTEIFKAINNNTITRVTVNVDSSGNRTGVTFNLA